MASQLLTHLTGVTMKTIFLLFSVAFVSNAFAWGQERHSIVAEVAQRRLTMAAASGLSKVLGAGVSLASV